MEKGTQGRTRHEQFVPPKPLYVESDTGDARPPVVEYLARHYRSYMIWRK